ncbi:MAG: hypothetical protein KDA65_07420 [Planctomycetaceae bacterium]|nr:hypothetical protein [Planctomycetaceae bacterium]
MLLPGYNYSLFYTKIPVFYWGDIDVEGFRILSNLRTFFPEVQSLLMDRETLEANRQGIVSGNNSSVEPPGKLTEEERETFIYCRDQNYRLEQEKIPQAYIEERLAKFISSSCKSSVQ